MANRQSRDLPPREGELDLGYLERDLAFLSRVLRSYIRTETGQALQAMDIEPGEIAITNLIGINPGVSQNDLAAAVVLKKSAVTKLVKSMESNGWVERRQVRSDKRYNALFLTAAGEARRQQMRDLVHVRQEAMLSVFSTAEEEQFFDLLSRLHAHLATRYVESTDLPEP